MFDGEWIVSDGVVIVDDTRVVDVAMVVDGATIVTTVADGTVVFYSASVGDGTV